MNCMTGEQLTLFALMASILALLVWGRYRYDLVAFTGLVAAVILGVVPHDKAFSGFGNEATAIIALVLIVSRGLSNSGAVELLGRRLFARRRSLPAHIGITASLGALASTVMNNVAALMLVMPIDLKAAERAKRSPALTLMPLSFATLLGGLVTLIGTPPNIILSSFRERAIGKPFAMFDFTPVGLTVAVAGVAFVALIGWRLLPSRFSKRTGRALVREVTNFIAEVRVPAGSPTVGKLMHRLDEAADANDVSVVGIVRNGKRMPGPQRFTEIEADDILMIEAGAGTIDGFVGALSLEYVGFRQHEKLFGEGLALMEVVIPENAAIEGRTALTMRLLRDHGVVLLGVSRQGERFHDRLRELRIRAGDVLLLMGPNQRLPQLAEWIGGLPLRERHLPLAQRHKAPLAVGLFAAAIAVASLGFVALPAALAAVCLAYVATGIVPAREVYSAIEWPVIVLIGSLLPIGMALESSGGTALLAHNILGLAEGYGPAVVLALLMIVTMTLADVLNNVATTVIAAPIAINVAQGLGVSPDPFLMAVAVAASCSFLTPIGHKNNTLIMGPGGYRFGDYWRMGLPLEILVVIVSLPAIMLFWPF
jgi:di/tricarboxylate transporter